MNINYAADDEELHLQICPRIHCPCERNTSSLTSAELKAHQKQYPKSQLITDNILLYPFLRLLLDRHSEEELDPAQVHSLFIRSV